MSEMDYDYVEAKLAEVREEIESLRSEIALLRESLAIFVHAHATGNSVPPHIESAARALLKEVPRG